MQPCTAEYWIDDRQESRRCFRLQWMVHAVDVSSRATDIYLAFAYAIPQTNAFTPSCPPPPHHQSSTLAPPPLEHVQHPSSQNTGNTSSSESSDVGTTTCYDLFRMSYWLRVHEAGGQVELGESSGSGLGSSVENIG